MIRIGETLKESRSYKKISLKKVSGDLHIKKEVIEDLENGDWEKLPEPTYVKGILRSYAKYLDLNLDHVFALYRREFDEAKYSAKKIPFSKKKRLMITPNKISSFFILLLIFIFASYLIVQYSSFLKAPKLEVTNPPDDFTTSVPVVQIFGKTDRQATIAVEGNFVAVDQEGNFSYDINLHQGQNKIEIIASKRLSPKSKITKIVRLAK